MTVIQFAGTGLNLSVTLSAVSSANRLIAAVGTYGITDIGTTNVANSAPGGSDTWTRRAVVGNGGVVNKASIWDCEAPTNGVTQVNISGLNGAGASILAVWEVSELNATGFDKSATGGAANSAAPATAATATLTQADEHVFALVNSDQGNTDTVTPTASEGWTQSGEFEDGTTGFVFNAVYKIVTATTAVSASWAFQSAHEYTAVLGTWKSTPGAPPTFVRPTLIVPTAAVIRSTSW